MADLHDRIFVESASYTRIPVHVFHAALIDYIESSSTRNQIISGFSLDTDATTDLDAILADIDAETGIMDKLRWAMNFHAVGLLAEVELKYTTKSEFRTRLGL